MGKQIYDLHITVDPNTFDPSFITPPWKVLAIQNTQGDPHLIVSRKDNFMPCYALEEMASKLSTLGVTIQRKKVERHFEGIPSDVGYIHLIVGTIEVHYKLKRKGTFAVLPEQIRELNKEKLAFSFSTSTLDASPTRRVVSLRFKNLEAYEKGRAHGELPFFIEEEEREIVIFDTNPALDTFWPLRTREDPDALFRKFPAWLYAT